MPFIQLTQQGQRAEPVFLNSDQIVAIAPDGTGSRITTTANQNSRVDTVMVTESPDQVHGRIG